MNSFFDRFHYSDSAKAPEDRIFIRSGVRFTVLTPRLIRVETQISSVFCDEPTQTVVNRQFDSAPFTVKYNQEVVILTTEDCEYCYSLEKNKMLHVVLRDGSKVSDFDKYNLKGTCRTLDGTIGKVPLENGIQAADGVSILDDSASLIVENNGKIRPRKCKGGDLYYFAYGKDYRGALLDYFRLTGMPPLIPRFALGNWWSRYKAYTQDEYLALIEKFKEKEIPLTVATVDMDWHWVDVVKKFGKDAKDRKRDARSPQELFSNVTNPGWTGYSWNRELFPSPDIFLNTLKESGLRVTMNLHPASGCKFFEDAYFDFCEFMGIDPASKEQIRFDIADPMFIEGYFRFLHHPHEKAGVDFWWIDWQQGKKSSVPGLDPLWALNHYHYLDNAADGKRPLILSRYAGPGSHRYPLGFSGDTAQTWSALDFQPYFTATAANIGYTWWSHDIGGHHMGARDDELYLRWVQFGVFSPIMRLHSTSNEFMGKEPWKYRGDVEHYATEALRFRHKLIPYIYTMAKLCHTEGRALCEPLYYAYPSDERAYQVKNEYSFGTQLLVCPITGKTDKKTNLAEVKAFIPKGVYTDIFTGRIYQGDTLVSLFRDETSIPVLAKAGAILPLSADPGNSTDNPQSLEIWCYKGTGSFTLYEDDGVSFAYQTGKFAETGFDITESEQNLVFTIHGAAGDVTVLPDIRNYKVVFRDVKDAQVCAVTVNGAEKKIRPQKTADGYTVAVSSVSPSDTVEIELKAFAGKENMSEKEFRIELISKLQGMNAVKSKYTAFALNPDDKNAVFPNELREPLSEYGAMKSRV